MSGALEAGSSLAYGFASAFVPLFNAEAYVGVYASLARLSLFAVVFAVGLGQTLGKVALFEGARRGQDLVRARTAGRRPSDRAVVRRVRAWGARLMRLLDDRRAGPATVLVSASIGVPPLAAVSVAAGASAQRRVVFAVCCLIGRLARFSAIAVPLAYAVG